ncbi:MAG TPA: protein kinase [Pirellulaceae bacterium]|nr:protein kinase [Pirellulaceae bacterium]
MPVAAPTFWTLLEQSRLLTAEQIRQLAVDFSQSGVSAEPQDATRLAEWLVSRNVISKYQATILLAGRSGPFVYGEYSVYDRIEKRRLTGWFRAVHRPTGHPVTLEFLSGAVVSDSYLWSQAANLALAATALRFPHLQRYWEPVDLGTFKFLVSEDMRGGSLEDKLAKDRIPLAEVCRCVRLAAIGLAHLHQAGRIHGDVRPANLWLESSAGASPGNVKLLYEPHVVAGPLSLADVDPLGRLSLMADYVAPELAQPGKHPDPLTDIYALGCSLYTLLAGTPPFAGGTPQQKLPRHASEPIRPLEQLGAPQPLAQLVAFLMAKNPAVRFQSAAIVAEQLTPFVDPQSVNLPAPAMPVTLPAYEAWLRQRQSQPLAQPQVMQPQVAALAPAIDVPVVAGVNVAASRRGAPATGTVAAELYKKKRKRKQIQLVIGTAITLLLAIAGGIYTFNFLNNKPTVGDEPLLADSSSGDGQEVTGEGDVENAKTDDAADSGKAKGSETAVGDDGLAVVPDDGKLLWASPTSGPSIDFRLVPPEGQVFVIVRPADILASPEGSKVLDALGPEFQAQRKAWEAAAGVPLAQVERLIISLHNNSGQFPRTSFVVRTKEPITTEELLGKWGQPQEQKEGAATWYAGKEWAYYVSADAQNKSTFLIATPADVKEVAKVAGAPPALLRDVERLRRTIDGDRHLTVLFYPPFLFNDDGRPLFASDRAKVKPALAWFLGDGLQAGQVSMHFDSRFYFELRLLGSLDKERYTLASEFRDRLKTVPPALEDYIDRITPPAYWSKLARRYPLMVQALHGNLRVGVESDQAIVNSYLEGQAAHGLVLGGELLLSSAPGTAVATAQPTEPAGPKTIEEVLALKTSMSFGSQSLEFAMRDIADDVRANLLKGSLVEFDIKLIGKDMEKDGITRNQSISDFKQEDKSVAEVLTAMVMKANSPNQPDPSSPDQKLIWVVAPDPDKPERQTVLITTRAAAEREKYKLPAPFQPKS